jgi:hypothetical protein
MAFTGLFTLTVLELHLKELLKSYVTFPAALFLDETELLLPLGALLGSSDWKRGRKQAV